MDSIPYARYPILYCPIENDIMPWGQMDNSTVAQLKARLRRCNLKVSGNKADLIARLNEWVQKPRSASRDHLLTGISDLDCIILEMVPRFYLLACRLVCRYFDALVGVSLGATLLRAEYGAILPKEGYINRSFFAVYYRLMGLDVLEKLKQSLINDWTSLALVFIDQQPLVNLTNPMQLAIKYNRTSIIQALISKGIDVNEYAGRHLRWSVEYDNIDILYLFIANGGVIDAGVIRTAILKGNYKFVHYCALSGILDDQAMVNTVKTGLSKMQNRALLFCMDIALKK